MRFLCLVLLLLPAIVSSTGVVRACETTIPPVGLARDWPRDDYKLLFLYPEVEDQATITCRNTVTEFLRQAGSTANLKLVELSARVAAPEVALLSPDDRVLFRGDADVTVDTLMTLVVSPARRALVDLLEKHVVVVLLVPGQDGAETRTMVEKSIKTFSGIFPIVPTLLTVRADDPAEKFLLHDLGIKADEKRSRVFVLFGWAKRLEADLPEPDEDKLLDRYHHLTVDTTVTYPHDYAPDLLLRWNK